MLKIGRHTFYSFLSFSSLQPSIHFTYFSGFEDFQKSLKKIIPTLQFVVSVDDPGKTLSTSGTVRQEITARLIGVLKEAIIYPYYPSV